MAFQAWDYVVFILMLSISAGIGVYYRLTGGKQKTAEEYLLADRNMSLWPVSVSLMASFMSAITLIGVSNEIYQFGTQFVIINLSYGLFTPVINYLFMPVFFKLQATSVYEYLEKRFGKVSRLSASIAFSFQMILYMGIVLYAPAISLQVVTNMDKSVAIVVIGLVCTFYSTIGGMKAVLWTDVFQAGLMFAAIFAVIISGLIHAGGFGEIWRVAEEGKRLEFFNFQIDPTVRHSWFSLIIGGGFTYMSLYGVSQTQVQRLLTIKKLKNAQLSMWVQWPILSALSFSTCFSGLVIYYYYHTCDPLQSGRITVRDQNMPLYVVDAIGHIPGLAGLFVSGIFAAGLSSISSSLNALAAVTMEDYFKPLYLLIKKKPYDPSPMKSAFVSKLIAAFYGCLTIGLAFLAQYLGGVLQASLTVFGVVGGPLLALFTLGMFTTRATDYGSSIGLLIGIAISMWIGFGEPKPPLPFLEFSTSNCTKFLPETSFLERIGPTKTDNTEYFYLYKLSYMYMVVLGFLITFIVGYLISQIFILFKVERMDKVYSNKTKKSINPDLFVPPLANYYRRQAAMDSENNSFVESNSLEMKITS